MNPRNYLHIHHRSFKSEKHSASCRPSPLFTAKIPKYQVDLLDSLKSVTKLTT